MKKILILIVCTLVTVSIFANQDVSECSSIKDDTERLSCYDKIFSSSNDLVVINSDAIIEIKEVETEELETINNENSLLSEITKETVLEERKTERTNSEGIMEKMNAEGKHEETQKERDGTKLVFPYPCHRDPSWASEKEFA